MTMSSLNTKHLATLISQRRRCLQQLRELGKRQDEMILASDMTALMQLLSAKQQLVTALQKIEVELRPYAEDDPEARVWESPAARESCAAEAAECRRLLEEVMEAEQRNHSQLALRRDDAAHQLRSVASNRQVRQAYQQHSQR